MLLSDKLKSLKNKDYVLKLVNKINELNISSKNIMEVCGGHTHAIQNFGLNQLLKDKVNFLSGPGCPVCVTPISYIDKAIDLSKNMNNIILTFGDIIRVPGSEISLEKAKSEGADIRVFYSPLDALDLIKKEKNRQIIFLAVGFETTVPVTAQILEYCVNNNIKNFKILVSHKTIIEAMELLLQNKKCNIEAYLCPGHVSAIIGTIPYENITNKFKVPCVVSGFEPLDILFSVYKILCQYESNSFKVENEYKRGVKKEGNIIAQTKINKYFEKTNAFWRGIGIIKNSGLKIKNEYSDFVIDYDESLFNEKEITGCRCGEILQGIKKPYECPLFKKKCTPQNPQGACMVSSEGACAAYKDSW